MVIHELLLLVALQPHSGVVVMVIVPDPPVTSAVPGDENVKLQVEIATRNASLVPPPYAG